MKVKTICNTSLSDLDKEINERMVSQTYYVDTTKDIKNAFKFTSNSQKQLRYFEELLKYEPHTLEFKEVSN